MSEEPVFDLRIEDIIDAVRIIDFCAADGAFKGWETIRSVLQVRDRLDAAATLATKAQNQLSRLNNETSELNESDATIEG